MAGLEQNPISWMKYVELKKDIDLTCKLLDMTIVKLTFIVVLVPPLLISAVNYFIYDLEDESYFLICPIMYVVYIPSLASFGLFLNLNFFAGCHSIGEHQSGIWLQYLYNLRALMQRLFRALHRWHFSSVRVGCSLAWPKILPLIYLCWTAAKNRHKTTQVQSNVFVPSFRCTRTQGSWVKR